MSPPAEKAAEGTAKCDISGRKRFRFRVRCSGKCIIRGEEREGEGWVRCSEVEEREWAKVDACECEVIVD